MPEIEHIPRDFLRGKRIVLVEDETLFLHLTSRYLTEFLGIRVVGQASDGNTGLRLCRKLKPDAVLVDLRLPELSGIDLIRIVIKELPRTKIVVVSAVHEPEVLADLIKMKVHGYISKMDDHEHFGRALTAVLSNRVYFTTSKADPTHDVPLAFVNHPRLRELSPREREVLGHICNGHTNKDIAELLGINTKTVESHRSRLCHKLAVNSTVELIVFAAKAGLIKI